MKDSYLFQVRVTGILIEEGKILIIKQRVSPERGWSLPGGRLEKGETLADGMAREMAEETGLETRIKKLLYVCEKNEINSPLLHISFLLEKTGGIIRLPSNELDENPITDVRMVSINDLPQFGFSKRFSDLIRDDFPGAGSYQGDKKAIVL